MDILYTDTDQIRGTLMLAPEDLPDAIFNADMLERELLLDLDSWLPSHATLVATSTTATDRTIALRILSYATYWCAYRALTTFAVSLPQEIGDGKNMRKLFPDFSELRVTVAGQMSATKVALQAAVSGSVAAAFVPFSVVEPALDPVTSNGT